MAPVRGSTILAVVRVLSCVLCCHSAMCVCVLLLSVHAGAPGAAVDELELVAPSILIAAPALWNALHANFCRLIADGGTRDAAAAAVRERVGGRVMIARVSAGPVSPAVGAFITEVFGRPSARAAAAAGSSSSGSAPPPRQPSTYGSTEADSISAGGRLLPFVEAAIDDCPELSYYSTDRA